MVTHTFYALLILFFGILDFSPSLLYFYYNFQKITLQFLEEHFFLIFRRTMTGKLCGYGK